MSRINRREIAQGAIAAAALTVATPIVFAQQGRQTLRFVPHADLKILDPVWTTAYITRNHGYLVYDTLFGTDENFQIKPQMVDRTTVSPDGMKYTFTLRDGLRWHDGQPVLSEDCVESLKRWGKKDRFGQLLMAHTAKIAPVDKKTFTLELAERFGPVLDALGKPSSNVPFMMPARIASTPADEQIKEIVGSGPFKFAKDEWQPGEQAVYVRNPDYVPRDEPPSGSTGGKKAYLDKVIWRYMADPWDAAKTSQRVKWTGGRSRRSSSSPRLNRTRISQTFLVRSARSARLAQAELAAPAVQQQEGASGAAPHDGPGDISAWAIGQPQYYRPCYSVFACGGPYATTIGAEPMMEHDLTKARQLVQESGYDGQPDRGAPRHRYSVSQRRGDRHSPTARVDRLQGRPQGDGLVDDAGRAGTQGAARQGRLEPASYMVAGGERHQSRRPLRHHRAPARAPGSAGPTSRSSRSLSPTGCERPIKRNESSSPTRSRRSLSAK